MGTNNAEQIYSTESLSEYDYIALKFISDTLPPAIYLSQCILGSLFQISLAVITEIVLIYAEIWTLVEPELPSTKHIIPPVILRILPASITPNKSIILFEKLDSDRSDR